ncbi:MAG: helicase HerA domain-containing protein [Promethearchaeota archaeon]
MSADDNSEQRENIAGRLIGKTTVHTNQLLITNEKVGRNNFFILYGEKDGKNNKKEYMANIIDIWSDKDGMMANIQVLGERPQRPFDMGSEVYLASKEQIMKLLGIHNPPEESVSIGNLIGYDIKVQLLVKNFGRIFVTGKSGSGKSYTMGVLCEEFLKKGIPVVIIDRHGEYSSLKVASEDFEPEEEDSLSRFCPWCGKVSSADAKVCENCGKEIDLDPSSILDDSNDERLESLKTGIESKYVDKIIEFADLQMNKGADIDIEYLFSLNVSDIVAPNLCTIVNLRGLSLGVQEIIASKLLKLLYQASIARKIPPFYLFLDEAHLFAGKKRTDTCETVKLFSQEGRKFGANLVLGTQRPQLLDTTIRAQAGTWIIHNLSDVNDIKITIQSAEDLSSQNKNDIQGLDKGESIICGEAIGGIPLFVKIRKRKTKHGGMGFNPLDFLPEQTVEELKKRKQRILGGKSEEELEKSKSEFQEIMQPKTLSDYQQEVVNLKKQINTLEKLNDELKSSRGSISAVDEKIQELEMDIKVWEEKYKALKNKPSEVQTAIDISSSEEILRLEAEIEKWKKMYEQARDLAARTLAELKKYE